MKTIRVSITFDTEDGAFDSATVDAGTIHNALCRAFPLCRSTEIRVEELPAVKPAYMCEHCGKPATCLGRYEDMKDDAYACDECCGHACEDGHCEPIEDERGEWPDGSIGLKPPG